MSAQKIQRHLSRKSSGQVWSMLQKIRAALHYGEADDQVRDDVIEWNAVTFQCLERYRE